MKKYQIIDLLQDERNAGSKAPSDVAKFANELGYLDIFIKKRNYNPNNLAKKVFNQLCYMWDWLKAVKNIKRKSLIFIQYQPSREQLMRKQAITFLLKIKKCKSIFLVHDIEELRKYSKDNSDYKIMIKYAESIIVHNERMCNFFIGKGYQKSKIVILKIFDYYTKDEINMTANIEKELVVAGNLDIKKAGYIYELLDKRIDISINLYGGNFANKFTENIEFLKKSRVYFNGEFSPDELPQKLKRGFGLVWDGNSLETCRGIFGEYLKFNSPHKISLYLVSGLPVVIWKESAMAKFVLEEEVGIVISDLKDIDIKIKEVNNIDVIKKNVYIVSKKLRTGYYTKQAITSAENLFL